MTDSTPLKGSTAAVTGASSGIGRAIAVRLAAAGAHVVVGGRDRDALDACVRQIEDAGGTAQGVPGDVRDPDVVNSIVDAAVAATDRLDVFVNNAGVMYNTPILEADVDKWRAMLETNVLALLVGCQAAVRAMRAGGRPGRIINISSVAALSPTSGTYGATKHAVNVISDSLRLELLEDPIQITTILPGVIATNIARTFDPEVLRGLVAVTGLDAEVTPGERIPDEVLEQAQVALSDFIAKPEDVAEAVLYAVSQPAGVHVAQVVVRPNKDLDF
jgi:NADP-dependent 3-hydroxy acid dehydrogenase YdfG